MKKNQKFYCFCNIIFWLFSYVSKSIQPQSLPYLVCCTMPKKMLNTNLHYMCTYLYYVYWIVEWKINDSFNINIIGRHLVQATATWTQISMYFIPCGCFLSYKINKEKKMNSIGNAADICCIQYGDRWHDDRIKKWPTD